MINTQPMPIQTNFIDFVDAGSISRIVKQTINIPITERPMPNTSLFTFVPPISLPSILPYSSEKENTNPSRDG